jgi:hypothetical protein
MKVQAWADLPLRPIHLLWLRDSCEVRLGHRAYAHPCARMHPAARRSLGNNLVPAGKQNVWVMAMVERAKPTFHSGVPSSLSSSLGPYSSRRLLTCAAVRPLVTETPCDSSTSATVDDQGGIVIVCVPTQRATSGTLSRLSPQGGVPSFALFGRRYDMIIFCFSGTE